MSGPAILWLFLSLALAGGDAAVTRAEIIAYAAACKAAGQRMDAIEKFGKDFSGLDLSGVDFRGAHTVTLETNLADADFSGSNLAGAQFGAAILEGANFSGANLEHAEFVAARLNAANFQKARLKGVLFQACHLTNADLAGQDLSQTVLISSDLSHANLSHSVFAGGDIEIGWGIEFEGANLTGADLRGLNLSYGNFRKAILHSTNLEGADLEGADFSSADLTAARLAGAKVTSANFRSVRGLTAGERQHLLGKARRWKFELITIVHNFLESLAFPLVLLVVVPLAAFGPRLLGRRRSPLPEPGGRQPGWQFSLASLFLLILGVSGLLGVALWSLTGAYSYSMVCALYLMVSEIVFDHRKLASAAKLLALALGYPAGNFVFFVVVNNDPFAIFNAAFMVTTIFVGPLAAVGLAALLAMRGPKPFPWIGMLGFVIWMCGVGFANLHVIASISGSI